MRLILLAAFAAALGAQEPARSVLQNAGKPMRVGASCTAESAANLGLQCSEQQPCPLYLELTGVELVANRILATGNIHTTDVTVESVLLASDDAGQTWSEPYQRIPSAGLDEIQFIDFETGWISGQLLLASPRDPFYLITGDGGKTWRRRPVSGESRAGTIEYFHFESRTQGVMLIDRIQSAENGMRYELYESATGGESWSLKQVDRKPIPVKRAQRGGDWRIRADAASKSFRIERKNAERWRSVASFLVVAGECRPAESTPEPREPPSTAAEPPSPPTPARKKAPSLRRD